jgi:hypothetical protein
MNDLIRSLFLLTVISLPLFATEDAPVPPISLAALANKADVIVLGQVKDTDYFYRHQYPVSGSAYLKVLIPYKAGTPIDLIEVYEKGLHENECYFPNPTVFEEGRRYLLFLRQDPDKPERYRGLAQGCALDVLVAGNNQYTLKFPLSGIALSDRLEDLAREMTFSDSYALENEETLTSTERNILLESGLIIPWEPPPDDVEPGVLGVPQSRLQGRQWIYTKGIDLTAFRKLMESPDNRSQESGLRK